MMQVVGIYSHATSNEVYRKPGTDQPFHLSIDKFLIFFPYFVALSTPFAVM